MKYPYAKIAWKDWYRGQAIKRRIMAEVKRRRKTSMRTIWAMTEEDACHLASILQRSGLACAVDVEYPKGSDKMFKITYYDLEG